jgi:hypothetical protein
MFSANFKRESQNLMQCLVSSVHCTRRGRSCVPKLGILASNRQNTASPTCNEDISLLISQYLITAKVFRIGHATSHPEILGQWWKYTPHQILCMARSMEWENRFISKISNDIFCLSNKSDRWFLVSGYLSCFLGNWFFYNMPRRRHFDVLSIAPKSFYFIYHAMIICPWMAYGPMIFFLLAMSRIFEI